MIWNKDRNGIPLIKIPYQCVPFFILFYMNTLLILWRVTKLLEFDSRIGLNT
jgi:hypothetical protein